MKSRWILSVIMLSVALVVLLILGLTAGSSGIQACEVLKALTGGDVSPQTRTLVLEIRGVRTVSAFLAGMAVSVCGLMMQTLFRNPLAGPYVLGVNSGASLGAALFVIGVPMMSDAGPILSDIGLAGAAWTGAGAVMLLVAFASRRLNDIMTVLILGMMFGAGVDAVVQVLQFLGDNMSLRSYILWTMGSVGSVSSGQLPVMAFAVAAGLLLAVASVKPLNMLLLGEEYAMTMGLDARRTRHVIYASVVLLAGTVTAFCGPVGFLGLVSPHVARLMTGTSDHRKLLPCTALAGGVLMLACDMASRLCSLPVNVMTSLIGVPAVIWIVLSNRNRK